MFRQIILASFALALAISTAAQARHGGRSHHGYDEGDHYYDRYYGSRYSYAHRHHHYPGRGYYGEDRHRYGEHGYEGGFHEHGEHEDYRGHR